MSLVGSGGRHIQNFTQKTSLAAADLDQSFGAIVEQVGGILWTGGGSSVWPGNLTRAENFAETLSIPRSFVRENRNYSILVSGGAGLWFDPASQFVRVNKAARVEWVSIGYSTAHDTGSIVVWVDGVQVATGAIGTELVAVVDVAKDVQDDALLRIDMPKRTGGLGTATVAVYLSRNHSV